MPHFDPNVNILERMVRAVEKVKGRLRRVTGVLEEAGIPYAVIGGNAVAAWVASVDVAAVRNTQDVDLLLDRDDFDRARQVLEAAGFVYAQSNGVDMFLDDADAGPRDAVHVIFAREKVRPRDEIATPGVAESERSAEGMRVLSLDALVRMKLTSYRRKDQVHLLDMIDVGLIDRRMLAHLPPALAARLQQLLETPEE